MKLKWIVGVLLLAAAAGWFFIGQKKAGAQRASVQWQQVPVERGDLEITVEATGIVQPQNRLEIKPPIPGRIEEVLVKEGETVKKGQILAWMSSADRAALLDAARAQGQEALSRWEEIYKPAPLVAPLDGTIIRRNVEPGQTVTAADAVFVLSDRLILLAQVDETDIGRIKLKQQASVTLDAYPDEKIPAEVDQIAFEAKTVNNVTIYEVDVLPATVPDHMRSGMTSNVVFVTDSRKGVLLVPSEAVKREEGRTFVMSGKPGAGQPKEKPVQTGATDGKKIEVSSGLNEGETVLVRSKGAMPSRKSPGKNPFQPDFQQQRRSSGQR